MKKIFIIAIFGFITAGCQEKRERNAHRQSLKTGLKERVGLNRNLSLCGREYVLVVFALQ